MATDVLGTSGRAMLRALITGETNAETLAQLARGLLRKKLPQLRKALTGQVTEHHRFLLSLHLDHLTHLETLIAQLEQRVGAEMEKDRPPEPPPEAGGSRKPTGGDSGPATAAAPALPKESPPTAPAVGLWAALWLLVTIPGISRRVAEVVLAEIGTDMGRFATPQHLASWAGLCPGNNESAGKRRSGRTAHGNGWLRAALVQAAWAATRTKGTYLSAQYRRLVRRCGKKSAGRGGAQHAGDVLPDVEEEGAVPGTGGGLPGETGPREADAAVGAQLESLGHKVTLEPKAVA